MQANVKPLCHWTCLCRNQTTPKPRYLNTPTNSTAMKNKPANKKAKKKNHAKPSQHKPVVKAFNRRSALKILTGVGLTGLGVTTLHAYDKKQKILHDLSAIGSGEPVVVQIHDPSCPTCRRLKSAVSTALKSRPGIQFRLADITTKEGKALQDKYGVPHVTLLFFNGNGRHIHTTRGLLTADQVRNNIDGYLS